MNIYVKFRKYSHIICVAAFAAVVAAGGIIVFARSGQSVVINEVCTSNVTCCKDDNGGFPDWIELYNPTGEDQDISGFSINRTSEKKKRQFVVPDGIVVPPGGFYVCDPGFKMSADGCSIELQDAAGNELERADIPKLKPDTTYARYEDGSDEWTVKLASPGYSNAEQRAVPAVTDGSVTASVPSGFYDEAFELELFPSNLGREVYYTTDGTDPVKNGIRYEGPVTIYDRSKDDNVYCVIPEVSTKYMRGEIDLPSFPVDKCTVVKAVAKDFSGRYTDICTFTYFIGYGAREAYDNMTVISVSTDPEDLYDKEDGIMVLGDAYDRYSEAGLPEQYADDMANFTRRGRTSERQADIMIFNEDHEPVLDTKAGFRLKGLSSRWNVQKSYSITFHAAYGGNYSEAFTVEGTDFDLHTFALDKCGQDESTKMKDTIMEYCMAGSDCAVTDRVPACLFLNGEYWGFYWLAQRFEKNHLSDLYGVDAEDVQIKDTTEFESYEEWYPDDFDRDSLMEYYAANIITAHEGDWPNVNFRLWRTVSDDGTKFGDGRYRPVIFDMNSDSMTTADLDSFSYLLEFYPFRKMTEYDESFAKELVAKIDEMENGAFKTERVLGLIDDIDERIRPQMIIDRMRYFNCSREESEAHFDESVNALRNFYKDRYDRLNVYKEKYLEWKPTEDSDMN